MSATVVLVTVLARNISVFADAAVSAICLMCIAIPFHVIGKHNYVCYVISFAVNSVSIGLAVTSYYIFAEAFPDVLHMIGVSLCALLLIAFVGFLLHRFPSFKKAVLLTAFVIMLMLAALAALCWQRFDNLVCSYALFCLVQDLIWLAVFRLTAGNNKRFVLRDVSFGGFGAVILVVALVIAAVTEDDSALPFELGAETLDSASAKEKKNK